MKLLVDTHLLLWAAGDPARLPDLARNLLDDVGNELLFSAASIWEVVIKTALGREDFQVNASVLRRGLVDNDWTELPIVSQHAVAVAGLPPIHKDPFDRIILAQAVHEGLVLLTSDEQLSRYGGPVRLV